MVRVSSHIGPPFLAYIRPAGRRSHIIQLYLPSSFDASGDLLVFTKEIMPAHTIMSSFFETSLSSRPKCSTKVNEL
jgi:hypothetical protein